MSLEKPRELLTPLRAKNRRLPPAQAKKMAASAYTGSLLRDSINTPTPDSEARAMGNDLWSSPAPTSLDELDQTNTTNDHATQRFDEQDRTDMAQANHPTIMINANNPTATHETVVTYTLDEANNILLEDNALQFDQQWSLDSVIAAPETAVVAAPIIVQQIPASMVAVNPCDVEGIEIEETKPVVVVENEDEPPKKKNKKGLRLLMPAPPAEPASPMDDVLDTPALENVLDKQAEESHFDLLDFVVNAELPVNDPGFMELIGGEDAAPTEEEATNLLSTINTSDLFPEMEPVASTSKAVPPKGKRLVVKKKKVEAEAKQPKRRGRPPSATVTSGDHAYLPKADEPAANPTEDRKYRRMRDLNNIASKRCRQNRKRKFQSMQEQEDELIEQNTELRARCRQLEDVVKRLKEQFIQKVANPKRAPLDLDALMSQRLSAMESV